MRLSLCICLLASAGLSIAESVAQVPAPSAGHELVYHDSLGVLLVNAGLGASGDSLRRNERSALWSWNGERWTMIDSTGPSLRNLSGVAYDSRRDVLVVYGGTFSHGRGAYTTYDETWEWDRRRGWIRHEVSGPGPRDHTQAAYDARIGEVLLFGGSAGLNNFPKETWSWNGHRWARLDSIGPPPRGHHSMVFDPVSRRVVTFGGLNGEPGAAIWARDTTWSIIGHTAPRTWARIAFDSRAQRMYVFGGRAQTFNADLLIWQDGTWRQAPAGPEPRGLSGLAFDKRRGVLVLFGGFTQGGLLNDTWEFDGTSWQRK